MRLRTLLVLWILAVASVASAQSPIVVSGQSGVALAASVDHNAVIPGTTTPVLDHYDLNVVAQNPAGALGFTFGLGKPTPDSTNTITVKPIANFAALVTGSYTATVAAVGPGGSSVSASTAPFVRAAPPAAPGLPIIVPK